MRAALVVIWVALVDLLVIGSAQLVGEISGVLELIALSGAAVAALGVMHVKVFRPTVKLMQRLNKGMDVLHDLPHWTKKTDERLARLERKADAAKAQATADAGR